jgi:CubicO group peptidase (beta-lactamase class C family)
MSYKKLPLLFLYFFLVLQSVGQKSAPPPPPLVRSTPEKEGVSSKHIAEFIDAVNGSRNEFHSFMMLRHGKVIAEGWWNPYNALLKHTMYSVSKSFTATAVGFAVAEKKLTVDDKVISFFPKDVPDTLSEYLQALTVKDLLTMTVGQEPDPTGPVVVAETNWIKAFLALPIKYKPGTKFLYNSLATYMLSAIVQKVTGQKVVDYLKPRLFVPLGITNVDWETDPQGINSGGWGFRIRTEDLAKFGQLFNQKGKWMNKQILPASWVEEATTMKIMQNPDATPEQKATSDWLQGYCYQMWRCRNNAYRGDGAFGQYIIVFPDHDAVIAITSETANMQDELNLVYKHLLPALQKGVDPSAGTGDYDALKKKLAALSLPVPQKVTDSTYVKPTAGRVYKFEKNENQVQSVSFSFPANTCVLKLKTDTATHTLSFGNGTWKPGVTTKRGPSLVGRAKHHFIGLPAPKVVGSYRWLNGHTLEMKLRYIESPHTETFTCTFNGDSLKMEVANSFGADKMIFEGKGIAAVKK